MVGPFNARSLLNEVDCLLRLAGSSCKSAIKQKTSRPQHRHSAGIRL